MPDRCLLSRYWRKKAMFPEPSVVLPESLLVTTDPFSDGYWGIRAAVLGASGFIGRWVTTQLARHGAKVYLVVRKRRTVEVISRKYALEGEIVEQDLSDGEATSALLHKIRPSIIFNLAGYGVDRSERDERKAYQINAELVLALCETIAGSRDDKWRGQDIVHVGSALEYGAIDGSLEEDSIPNPTTLYGGSKLAGTSFLSRCSRAYGIKGVTARLFTVYGPGEHSGRLLPSLLAAARSGRPIRLTAGDQVRDFTYVEDVAEGLLRIGLATAMPGAVVNLATGRLTPVRSFVETAAGILRIPYEALQFGMIPTRPEEMQHRPLTLARLRELTSWVPPTGIAEGIRKTLEFKTVRTYG